MSYDPTIGRWIEADPAEYIDGPNEYQMERSNPVDGLDPLGLWDWPNLSGPSENGGLPVNPSYNGWPPSGPVTLPPYSPPAGHSPDPGGVLTNGADMITTSASYNTGRDNFVNKIQTFTKQFAQSHACGNGSTHVNFGGAFGGAVYNPDSTAWNLYHQLTIGEFWVTANASADVKWSTANGVTTVTATWRINYTCNDPWHLHTPIDEPYLTYWRFYSWHESLLTTATAKCANCESSQTQMRGGHQYITGR